MADMSDAEAVPDPDNELEFRQAIEAVVLVAHDPVPPDVLAQLARASGGRHRAVVRASWPSPTVVEAAGSSWSASPAATATRPTPTSRPYVERFLLHDQRARLSGAALETLAIVAYKQPISRAQIASIRGVDPDGVLRTLHVRGYVDAVARDTGPGQAVLYGTTAEFLERLGIDSIADLPPIAEFIPGADVVEALEVGLRVSDARTA